MKKIFTIPNILSTARLCLIPFIVTQYFSDNYLSAVILLVASGLTDVVDGFIARHFNMISDVGKILDPIADKLTQITVAVCLSIKHPSLITLVLLIMFKEGLMLIGAVSMINKTDETPYARWWGKLSTVLLYALMVYVVIDDYLGGLIPEWTITVFSVIAIIGSVFSLANYYESYRRTVSERKEKERLSASAENDAEKR
ncbi:MAG: CDP-alcohol phosphatidyltransferase family protein [Firmicutes bacterium]|nr:CDP-alcohol phosphatidyltransferase family protein [Bacillota bacterium]